MLQTMYRVGMPLNRVVSNQVDFLATRALTAEELQTQRADAAAASRAKRTVRFQNDGAEAAVSAL